MIILVGAIAVLLSLGVFAAIIYFKWKNAQGKKTHETVDKSPAPVHVSTKSGCVGTSCKSGTNITVLHTRTESGIP